MTARYIEHVTLDSGQTRRSPRSEISTEPLAAVSAMLEQALVGGNPQVRDDCTMTAAAYGRCMIATVWKPLANAPQPVPLVTIGVATHSRCGTKLWHLMHDGAVRGPLGALMTVREQVPPEPWCAARLEIGATLYPDEMFWIGDFERVLAWSWIDRKLV